MKKDNMLPSKEFWIIYFLIFGITFWLFISNRHDESALLMALASAIAAFPFTIIFIILHLAVDKFFFPPRVSLEVHNEAKRRYYDILKENKKLKATLKEYESDEKKEKN